MKGAESSSDVEETELLVKTPTPLPLGPLFVLCCVVLSESFSITMIFPFIADMVRKTVFELTYWKVRDFGIDEADIGFYAGWIASSFNIAQFCSSFAWGKDPLRQRLIDNRESIRLLRKKASPSDRPIRQLSDDFLVWMVHFLVVCNSFSFN